MSSGHGGAAGGLRGAYEQVASVHGHSDSVLRVAWSPDGALLASGALHSVYVLGGTVSGGGEEGRSSFVFMQQPPQACRW